METLHRGLHSKLRDVPTPEGAECKRAYMELCRQEKAGLISLEDPPWVRLQFLIEMWEETCPATVAVLQWQKEIFYKFYSNNNLTESFWIPKIQRKEKNSNIFIYK